MRPRYIIIALMLMILALTVSLCAAADEAHAPQPAEIGEANTARALLERHSSISIYRADYTYIEGVSSARESALSLINSDEGVILYGADENVAWVYDGGARYMIYPNGEYGVELTLDNGLSDYYAALIDGMRLYEVYPGERLASIEVTGRTAYTVTTRISMGDYSDATGAAYDLDETLTLTRAATVSVDKLQLNAWRLDVEVADGIAIPLQAGTVVYDDAVLPTEYYLMANPQSTRTITLIDPTDATAAPRVFTIADGAMAYVTAAGYDVTVLQDGRYVDADEANLAATGDLTLYLIPIDVV